MDLHDLEVVLAAKADQGKIATHVLPQIFKTIEIILEAALRDQDQAVEVQKVNQGKWTDWIEINRMSNIFCFLTLEAHAHQKVDQGNKSQKSAKLRVKLKFF